MALRAKGAKGYILEELLRAYFLRAGFFAVRGVPFLHGSDDLSDIDLWLYERPTGSSRRRQIVDAKSKVKPKAIERLLWTKGMAQLLDVEGAYVATTDARPMLRIIGKKLGLSILDGSDIKRIEASEKVAYPDRMTEEELSLRITSVDQSRRDKQFQQRYQDIKHSLIDNFGAGTINRALDTFEFFSSFLVTAHPDSASAETAMRLAYFAAAVVALSLDYIASEVSFRTSEERRIALINAIRYGSVDEATGFERIRLAVALIQKYAPNGEAAARTVDTAVKADLRAIPAEIIAEHIVKSTKAEALFQIARQLEHHCFSRTVVSFDALGMDEKSFIAVLLDYCGIDRGRFASGWTARIAKRSPIRKADRESAAAGPLFSNIDKTVDSDS